MPGAPVKPSNLPAVTLEMYRKAWVKRAERRARPQKVPKFGARAGD